MNTMELFIIFTSLAYRFQKIRLKVVDILFHHANYIIYLRHVKFLISLLEININDITILFTSKCVLETYLTNPCHLCIFALFHMTTALVYVIFLYAYVFFNVYLKNKV